MGKRVGNFKEESARLAPLKTFDPAAFLADEKVPQVVCDFVLSLALFYNDLKDSIYGYSLLRESVPPKMEEKRPDSGAYAGVRFHFMRYHVGLVHELCELIKKNQGNIEQPFFRSVVTQMPKREREAWQAVVDVALERSSIKPLARPLAIIRNKVSSHYDQEEISRGFRNHFFTGQAVRNLSTILRHSGQSFTVQKASSTRFEEVDTGLLIQAAVGTSGGFGTPLGNRSGWTA